MSKNQKSISYIYVKSYGAHPVGCIGSTTFDAIAEASAVYQLGTSFVGTVVNDLETDVQGGLERFCLAVGDSAKDDSSSTGKSD